LSYRILNYNSATGFEYKRPQDYWSGGLDFPQASFPSGCDFKIELVGVGQTKAQLNASSFKIVDRSNSQIYTSYMYGI
jgi:hypothetical protein